MAGLRHHAPMLHPERHRSQRRDCGQSQWLVVLRKTLSFSFPSRFIPALSLTPFTERCPGLPSALPPARVLGGLRIDFGEKCDHSDDVGGIQPRIRSHVKESKPLRTLQRMDQPSGRWCRATPFFPACGPVTGSFNGLHRESNFLAINAQPFSAAVV